MDFGAISRDFERKILRPRKFFENFDPKCAANRTESHAPRRADARHSCRGPLTVVSKLRTTKRHAFWRDLMRFRTKNFAAAKTCRTFRSEMRCTSHGISRAAACRRSAPCLGTSVARREAVHRQAARISVRSHAISNEKFRGRENFRKFRSDPPRIARNLTRHSMLTVATDVGDLQGS